MMSKKTRSTINIVILAARAMQRKSQEAEGEGTQEDGSHGWPMVLWGPHCLGEGGTTARAVLHPTEFVWECSTDCKVHGKIEVLTGLILLWGCNFPKYSIEEPTINVKSWPQTFLEAADSSCNPPAAELGKGDTNLDTLSSCRVLTEINSESNRNHAEVF